MKLTDLSEQEAKELADQYLQRLKSAGVKLLNTKEMTVLNGLRTQQSFRCYERLLPHYSLWLERRVKEEIAQHKELLKQYEEPLNEWLQELAEETD